jgi:hypothetical protein
VKGETPTLLGPLERPDLNYQSSDGATRHHIPEDGIIHSHRRENFKSYKYVNSVLHENYVQYLYTYFLSLSFLNSHLSMRFLILKYRIA